MTVMIGSVLRVRCGYRLPAVCCAALTVVALAGGCVRSVAGSARPGDVTSRPAQPISAADLLIEPTRFPTRYPAAIVPSKDVDRVLGEIDGVATGSEVTPAQCAPLPVLAEQKAAVEGIDDESGSRLVVTVIRPVPSVRARVAQLKDCSSFTSTAAGEAGEPDEVWKVTVDLPPPPPVDADDSYAVEQTVTSQSGNVETTTLTLVALIDDVQVAASWQQGGPSDASPDTESLDTLFTAAVLKVRQQVPR